VNLTDERSKLFPEAGFTTDPLYPTTRFPVSLVETRL